MARRYDLKGFLEYTKLVTTCESYCTATEPVVSELEGMLGVLSQHGIQNKVLKGDLQKLQEKWTLFCSRVDSEGAFVAKQTPSSTKALMNTIQVCVCVWVCVCAYMCICMCVHTYMLLHII